MVLSTTDYFDEDGETLTVFGPHPAYVSLQKGQRVMFLDDTTLDIKAPAANSDGSFNPGMYKVGKDIKPGKYKLVPTDAENGYIVYYDLQYIDLSVADSAENLGKDKVIELASGRYIEFAGLKLVPYVEPKPTEPSSETSSESSSETSSESGSDKDKDKDNDADTPKNNEAGDNNVGDNKN